MEHEKQNTLTQEELEQLIHDAEQEVRCAANTHPDLCVRAMELDRWCHSVRYEELKG